MKAKIIFNSHYTRRDPIASSGYIYGGDFTVYLSRRQERALLRRLRACSGDYLEAWTPDGRELAIFYKR